MLNKRQFYINGREGGIRGLEEFLEVKSVSGWAE